MTKKKKMVNSYLFHQFSVDQIMKNLLINLLENFFVKKKERLIKREL